MIDPFSSQLLRLLRMAKDEGYALGVQHSMQRLAQSERILRDLIAELRAHCREPSCGCDIGRAADYAETRLRLSRDD